MVERKLRMLQIQGIKGEAVVDYCEPLITKKMGIIGFPERETKWNCIKNVYLHIEAL